MKTGGYLGKGSQLAAQGAQRLKQSPNGKGLRDTIQRSSAPRQRRDSSQTTWDSEGSWRLAGMEPGGSVRQAGPASRASKCPPGTL